MTRQPDPTPPPVLIDLQTLTAGERRDLANALLRAARSAALEPTRIVLLDLFLEVDETSLAHARRTYPRDSKIVGVARFHRIIRRSSSYGPRLPEGVLEDDGADRGILFFCLQANLVRGFEFVKTQWINEGTLIGAPAQMDPLVGPNDGTGCSPSSASCTTARTSTSPAPGATAASSRTTP